MTAYKTAGVDIAAGEAFVRAIAPLVATTHRSGVIGGLGGYGAVFDPRAAGFVSPKLVVSTDGVGTKLKLAIELGRHDTIGIDLVAMCVNDVITRGAKPVLFLDYFATARLDSNVAMAIMRGIVAGCDRAGCALVGGETAEMPGFYPDQYYDLAGFVVGLANDPILPAGVRSGDLVIGLASNGVHSNGFSLVHHLVQQAGLAWTDAFDASRTLGETFLTPTRLYVETVLAVHQRGLLHAAAHITGGGLIGNLPRILPPGLGIKIDQPWLVPAEFGWLREQGSIGPNEMLRTYNCGIGMVLIIPADAADKVIDLAGIYDTPVLLGRVVAGGTTIMLPEAKWWA